MSNSVDTETWRDIKGYEGIYQVSSHGRVKSLSRNISRCHGTKALKESIRRLMNHSSTRGYSVTLTANKKSEHCLVSRLVAEAFLSNPHNYKRIVHLDGNKKNNHFSNLAYRESRDTYKNETLILEELFSCLGVSSLEEVLVEVKRLKKESDMRS